METISFPKRKGYLALGGLGVLFSAAYLGASFRLPFGQMDQPGAAVFPVLAGVLLMFSSLTTLWEGWRQDPAEKVALPAGEDLKRLLILVGLLMGYFLLLPWLGQIVTSLLFCILLIRLLSGLGWVRVLVYSPIVSFLLYFVFVYFLKVPMPRGVLAF